MADRKFKCHDCGKEFMEFASPRKDIFGKPVCPHCGKEPANVERVS